MATATCTNRMMQALPARSGSAGRRPTPAVARSAAAAPPRRPPARLQLLASASSTVAASAGAAQPTPLTIPRGPQETVQQAAAACIRAYQAGVRRQRVELLLPLIGATDLVGIPCRA